MRVSPIIGRAGGAMKTYAEFQAYIAALAVNGALDWYDSFPAGNGSYRSTAKNTNPAWTSMTGTSWGPASANGFSRAVTSVSGAATHGVTSQAIIDAQVAAGREMFFKVTAFGTSANVISLTRNGFTSTAGIATNPRVRLDEIRYFDPALGPVLVDPFNGTGPAPFTW